MKALKAFFLSRLLTEKILLTGFLLIIALTWCSHVFRSMAVLRNEFRNTSVILDKQDVSLAGKDETDRKVKQALSKLDPASTLDSARLQGDLNTLAAGNGLSGTIIETRPDQAADQFIEHSVQFSVRKVDYGALLKFYEALSKRAPYITIEQCSISADRADPNQLNASMLISSVEMAK